MLICGFILPRMYLSCYGSAINGLINSITNFLGFITLAECGVGAVVESALYKPLADSDKDAISRIFVSSERFFRKISFLLIVYVSILIIIYPYFIGDRFERLYTASLIFIISISSFVQYMFGVSYTLLLNADQRGYIVQTINICALLINTILCIILMKLGLGIHMVRLISSLVFVLKPFVLGEYVRKRYALNRKLRLIEEPIKQKWNGFAQHIASVVLNKTDIVVLTMFSTLENVSIYGVYHMVVQGLMDLVQAATSGLQALLGNQLARKEYDALENTFSLMEWIIHMGTTFIFTVAGILIVPFINVYTQGITDANYIVPMFAVLITLAQGVRCLRLPYNTMVLAAGHYKQTQNSAFFEAIVNLVASIISVSKYGLVGVAIGTLIAMLYRTCYLAWYLSRNIIKRKLYLFVIHCIVDVLNMIMIILCTKSFFLRTVGYFEWFILALKVGTIGLIITLLINYFFYRQHFKCLLKKIHRKV